MQKSPFSTCARWLTNAVLLMTCFVVLLWTANTGLAAIQPVETDDHARGGNAEQQEGIPPLFVTHEGVTYNFTREKFGTWKAAAEKDGKTLWERTILPHPRMRTLDEIKSLRMANGVNAIPRSGWYVAYRSYRFDAGLSLGNGEQVRFIGRGFGPREQAVPHALARKPQGELGVHTVKHGERTYTARSDGDMFGPWRITCTDAAKKVAWDRKLPRGIWISGMKTKDVQRIMNAEPLELKTFTLLDIEGCRHLLIETGTGDVVSHESYRE